MPAHASASTDPVPSADHHLWRNGRLWWVAFTVHLPPWQKERVRLSLGTDDLDEARRRRDELLRRYPQERGCTLSLRCAPEAARSSSAGTRARADNRQRLSHTAAERRGFASHASAGWPGAARRPQAPPRPVVTHA